MKQELSSLEIHKKKGLQLCLRALFLRSDCSVFIKHFVDAKLDAFSPSVFQDDLVQQLRDECRQDERYTLDQLRGIVEMLNTIWEKADIYSAQLQYANTPSIYNALLHFVDHGALALKDNDKVVCHWEDLLRWHTLSSSLGEDLLVCAYLASADLKNAQAAKRNDFSWPAYIKTDDPTLEAMLELPLADIHAHLKGSSLNFEINWLCLMNHIDGREEQFKNLASFTQGTHHGRRTYIQLYRDAIVAAAIRLYLAQQATGIKDYPIKDITEIMNAPVDENILGKAQKLQEAIQSALEIYGKSYVDAEKGATRLDYAIRDGVTIPRGKQESCAYSLMSGERYILYSTLKDIYGGKFKDGRIATLLFIYLLFKNEIRHEISQLNDTTGFDNFRVYEERKFVFVKGDVYEVYKKAAIHLAVASFFGDSIEGSRYHEARITPEVKDDEKQKDALELNIEEINFNDKAIEDPMFKTCGNDNQWAFRYIYHFIKEKDNSKDEYFDVNPRHHELRVKVKEQAEGIWELRNSLQTNSKGEYYADRIVGIDAANSEIACRPEVFAQAFRYLRRHRIKNKQTHSPSDLGITYHVGEDFMDIVDGLRAVDEAMRFLQLQKGDRIGHGLVLGVEVERYYKLRNHTIALSLQMQMDNAAWLWKKMTRIGIRNEKCKAELEHRYGDCFRRVYTDYGKTPSIDLYYSSMLLRGDNPACYDIDGQIKNPYDPVDEWGSKSLVRTKECDEARKQIEARKLYHLYHYDKAGKINGRIYDTWEVNEEMCQVIKEMQQNMLQQVEDLGIAIECNPTSNYKIGEIDRYDRHPITKFNTIKGEKRHPRHDISASINTDDKGVFSTSIEREYALVAHALIRKYRLEKGDLKDSDVYEWLDNIRLHSISQRFDKNVHLQEHTSGNRLKGLKEKIRQEVEDDYKGQVFGERLRQSIKILFGKRNG